MLMKWNSNNYNKDILFLRCTIDAMKLLDINIVRLCVCVRVCVCVVCVCVVCVCVCLCVVGGGGAIRSVTNMFFSRKYS